MARTNDGLKRCRGCGLEILIIKTGTCYKNVVVDAEPVWVKLQTGGELFFTVDGHAAQGTLPDGRPRAAEETATAQRVQIRRKR